MLAGRKKTSKGRQKIELKRIENEDARYISFSKRRNGVFTKASEISTLCGAEVLVLIYSPAGNPHTFGSPDVNQLADRFFSGVAVHPIGSPAEQAYRKGRMHGLNSQLMELSRSVDALKVRNNSILEHTMAMTQGLDLDENKEGMTFEKLAKLNNKLVDLLEQAKGTSDSLLGEEYPDPGVITKPFESGSGTSDRFTPLNTARGLDSSSERSQLFQINWSTERNRPTNLSPFDPEFYLGRPSKSTNSILKLNNLF